MPQTTGQSRPLMQVAQRFKSATVADLPIEPGALYIRMGMTGLGGVGI